jgi:hypothetical protein
MASAPEQIGLLELMLLPLVAFTVTENGEVQAPHFR